VITVCDKARENCPILPGHHERLAWSFDDPSAANDLATFRRVRDEIRERLRLFPAPTPRPD
jgi:arsenate reductase